MKKNNPRALLPILVFLLLYLGLGLSFEYVLKIPMGFYNIPIVICFLIAILVACLQNPELSFDKKLEIMGQGVGDKNIVTMLLIFLVAGTFVGVVGRSSAESVAYFMLSIIPARFAVAVLFVVACFVSTAMGTSVGTITLITPIAVSVASASGFGVPLCIGAVMGGAMFGDNLSFISDTTIASTKTQECVMRDKFRVNSMIVVPAAIIVLGIYIFQGLSITAPAQTQTIEWIKVIPYIIVLGTAIAGMNVMLVLIIGILTSGIIGIATGSFGIFDWFGAMGTGITGMGELIIITLLAGGMLETIRYNGGIDFIIRKLTRHVNGKRGAELSIAALVSITNLCTANNTIAIITTGPIAKDIAVKFHLDRRKTASILDTFSCLIQGIIPYGAQMLIAAGLASISPISIIGNLYYPFTMGACALLAILFRYPKRYS